MVFHTFTNENLLQGCWPSSSLVKALFFFFRLLTFTEKNYWPTELEIAGFVWVNIKVRNLIQSFRARVIIQTNQLAILDILQQFLITSTTSTMKMNLRLLRLLELL